MAKIWYSSATVKAAIIFVIGSVIVAGMYILNNRSQIKQDNEKYKLEIDTKNTKINNLQQELSSKNAEIQKLETSLIPFKVIALEKYTGSEQETLRKLANELKDIKKATDIPSLSLMRERLRTVKDKSGYYTTTFVFRPSNRLPVGSTAFTARVIGDSEARINVFSKYGVNTGVKKYILKEGKEATYHCDMKGYEFPKFKLVTTGPATIQIIGAHLANHPVIFEVK